MPIASRNGLELYFETLGDVGSPPLLLVAGLGMQLVDWGQEWLDRLVADGFFVVAYDNRDVGLSTHLSSVAPPELGGFFGGERPTVPYYLGDMADDAMAVLDELDITDAHVLGVSMGGMIAQQIAIAHPGRVRSLCSIMSTTGAPGVGLPTQQALVGLLEPPAESREEAIARAVATSRLIGSPAFPPDEDDTRAAAAKSYDRSHDADGVARQLAAILASPERTGGLGNVLVPTVVIHGKADPLIQPDGGEATAAAVPGARLVLFEGMGHDLPPELWDEIVGAVLANTARADGARVEIPGT